MEISHKHIGDRPLFQRRLLRTLILALVGYAVFAVVGVACWATSQAVDWTAGLFVALAFALSELFNTGRGRAAGIVRRIGTSTAIMVVSGLCSAWLFTALGWRGTYELQERTE